MDSETQKRLGDQLIKLGDMMGDGLHHEPDGKWISREYRKVATALGYIKKQPRRAPNRAAIDERMKQRLAEVACPSCSGPLVQTRSGSMRAKCAPCNRTYQLLKAQRRKCKG